MAQKKKRADKVDKRLRARVNVGMDANGNPVYKWASGRTRAELAAAKADLAARYANGAVDAGKITLGAYAQTWYDAHCAGLSASTRDEYRSMLNAHLLPALGSRYLRSVTHGDLQALLHRCERSRATVSKLRSIIALLFAAARQDGYLQADPSAHLRVQGKAEPHPRRALTPSESQALARVMTAPGDPDRQLLLMLLYYLGLRLGEAPGLRWDDVDWAQRTVHIQRAAREHHTDLHDNAAPGALKTTASDRVIPIPSPLYAALRERRGIGWMLPGRGVAGNMTYSQATTLWQQVKRDMARTAVELGLHIELDSLGRSILTPHYLRHNYATMLYDAGVDVLQAQAWLGHASSATTLGIYTHISQDRQALNASRLDDLFSNVAASLPHMT